MHEYYGMIMQSPELVPPLVITTIMMILTLVVILRSYLKNKMLPSLFYSLTVIFFSALVIDQLLDQTYLPFRDVDFTLDGVHNYLSNFLLVVFLVIGFLFWYLAIIYSQYENPPQRAFLLFFIAGGILFSEFANSEWKGLVPFILQIAAVLMMTLEVINYARKVMKSIDPNKRKLLALYFLGYLLWIMAIPLGVILDNIPGFPSFIKNTWVIPFTSGLFLISYSVAIDPRVLFISDAQPLDLLIFDKNDSLLLVHRFKEYPGCIDRELMGSAMSGVLSLMKELLASGKRLLRVDHGDVKVLVETGNYCTFLLVATQETSRFRQMLRNAVWEFEINYQEGLMSESPIVSNYEPFRERIAEMFV